MSSVLIKWLDPPLESAKVSSPAQSVARIGDQNLKSLAKAVPARQDLRSGTQAKVGRPVGF